MSEAGGFAASVRQLGQDKATGIHATPAHLHAFHATHPHTYTTQHISYGTPRTQHSTAQHTDTRNHSTQQTARTRTAHARTHTAHPHNTHTTRTRAQHAHSTHTARNTQHASIFFAHISEHILLISHQHYTTHPSPHTQAHTHTHTDTHVQTTHTHTATASHTLHPHTTPYTTHHTLHLTPHLPLAPTPPTQVELAPSEEENEYVGLLRMTTHSRAGFLGQDECTHSTTTPHYTTHLHTVPTHTPQSTSHSVKYKVADSRQPLQTTHTTTHTALCTAYTTTPHQTRCSLLYLTTHTSFHVQGFLLSVISMREEEEGEIIFFEKPMVAVEDVSNRCLHMLVLIPLISFISSSSLSLYITTTLS